MNPTNVSQPSSSSSKPDATSTFNEVKGAVAGAAQTVKDVARDAASQIKNTATETASQVKEQASEIAGEQKEGVANRLGGVSSSIHDSAKSLEEKDPNIAWITHQTADRIQKVADYVRNRDFGQLRDDAEDFARRHPTAFFGGLFLAGIVVGNLLKATSMGGSYSSDLSEEEDDGTQALSDGPAAEDVPGQSAVSGALGSTVRETMT